MVRGVSSDTRGIIDPAAMLRHVDFARYPAGAGLAGIIDWFWAVRWNLPDGVEHRQLVLNHPSGHVSIGTLDDSGVLDPAQGRVYGVLTRLSERRLTGRGWTVAAKTTVGGAGVVLGAPARTAVDRQLPLRVVSGLDEDQLVDAAVAADAEADRVDLLREALERCVRQRDPDQVGQARQVAAIARLAETDRGVRRTEQLADAAGVSVRTLQRRFAHHVGVSPAWVIRRWRIIEAAEQAVRADEEDRTDSAWSRWPGWASLSVELGYSDQSHLVRDVRRHLGLTPHQYRRHTKA